MYVALHVFIIVIDVIGSLQGDRYYYDGSIKCYDGVHLFYAVISYLLISTIIIPGPFIVVLISYRHFKVITHTMWICSYINGYTNLSENSSI